MVCDERYGDQLKKGYSNTDFHAARQSKATFVTGFEAEWASQRTLALDAPLDALLPAKEGEEAYYIAIDIQDEVRGLFVPAPRNMLMCVHFPFFFLCLCLCLCLCFSYPHPTHTTTNNTHLTHTPLSLTHTHTVGHHRQRFLLHPAHRRRRWMDPSTRERHHARSRGVGES